MIFGGYNLDDKLSIAFLSLTILFGTISLIIVVTMMVAIVKQLKSKFIDVLKLLQYIAIMLWYLAVAFDIVLHFSSSVLSNFIYIIFLHFDWIILIYYAINQLSWYLLWVHLETYRQLAKGENYISWREKIIVKEAIWFFLVLSFYFFAIVWSMILYISSNVNSDKSELSKDYSVYYFITLIIIEFLFGLNEIRLYFKITSTMKKTLNYYYNQTKSNLKKLTIVNSIFFFGVSWINLLFYAFGVDAIEYTGYEIINGYPNILSSSIHI